MKGLYERKEVTTLTQTMPQEFAMLPDGPEVSILVNCKNGARTIRRCIEGILSQTYPRVELVFQDGGSTDGTLDIVEDYIKRNPGRIRLSPT